MKNYRCSYTGYIADENYRREHEISANSSREAYELFIAREAIFQIPVQVDPPGMFAVSEVFRDHIDKAEAAPDKATRMEAADAKRQEMHAAAAEDAQASLSSTDMLLKQLIAEQKHTNERLHIIRWLLACICIILAIWNIRVFG